MRGDKAATAGMRSTSAWPVPTEPAPKVEPAAPPGDVPDAGVTAAAAASVGRAKPRKAPTKKASSKEESATPEARVAAGRPVKAASSTSAKRATKAHTKPRSKLVRDSFTMPQQDFDLVDLLKQRCLDFKRPTKKSELLRAGLQALAAMPPAKLKTQLGQLIEVKTGRPKKSD